jgi:beta-lactamase regulating signal transducer with metallopeptidase domain
MTDSWLAAAGWLGHTALVGGAVLLLGWVGVLLVKAPARRQRLAAWAVRAAVLAPVLCLLPAWLTVPAPAFVEEELAPAVRESPPAAPPAEEPAPAATEFAAADPPGWWDAELTLAPVAVVELPPAAALPPPAVRPRAEEPVSHAPAPAPAPAALTPAAPEPVPPEPRLSPLASAVPLVLSAYAMVVAALLGQVLVGHVGLARLVRAGRPAPFRVQAVFDELTAGMRRKPRLLVCDRVASPVCFGLFRPTVLLPESLARAGTEAELRWVFAHELDHVRRGDLATGWWVGLARAVYFFVPWFWPLRRELSLAQEYLADAAAAAADGRPVDYAAFLVNLSGGPARLPRLAHAVRAGRSDLFRRVTMLLQSGAGLDRRCPRGWAALAAGGVLSAAVLLSGLGLASADDEKPQPEKTAKQEKAEKARQEAERAEQAARDAERAARDRERTVQDRARDRDRERTADDVAGIKKAIAEAAQKGDVDEVRRLAERLEKAMSAPRGERPRRDPEKPQPPVPPKPPALPRVPGVPDVPFGRFDPFDNDRMKEAMQQAERSLKEAMERLKDNPEAREQLERALKEYHKAMEQGMKRAEEGMKKAAEAQDKLKEWRKANPDAPFPPGFEEMQKRFGGEFGRGFGPTARRAGGGRLGVAVSPVPEALAEQLDLPTGRGVVVNQVHPGSAAEKAGLRKNDVILSFAGQSVDAERFTEEVAQAKPGQKVDVVVLRKGKRETIKGIELPEAPKPERRGGGGDFEYKAPKRGEFKVPTPPTPPTPGKGGFERTTVSINDDEFTIDATKGDVRYRLTGTIEGGKPVPSRIEVTGDGKKKASYKSFEDVPEEHRDAVKQLLGSVGRGR